MHFVRHGESLRVSRITGPRHYLLDLVFGTSAQQPAFAFLPAIGGCSHPPLDPDGIVRAVLAGVAEANRRLGTSYAVARIGVPENDTPPVAVYGALAAAIVERLHAGEPFEER